MSASALASVMTHAALPQKIALSALTAGLLFIVAVTVFGLAGRHTSRLWCRLVRDLRVAGPALGLLVGAMNSFHMAQTIQRVPFDPTAKQLAPGILEVSTFVGLGALVGLAAIASGLAMAWAEARQRSA
jgi:hypothetical protein